MDVWMDGYLINLYQLIVYLASSDGLMAFGEFERIGEEDVAHL
jgi:hypothetical protein